MHTRVFSILSRRFWLSLLLLLFTATGLWAQSISLGPVFGGVTDTSVVVYIRTTSATPITLELDDDPAFGSPLTYNAATVAASDSVALIQAGGLQPRTTYHARFKINGTVQTAGTGKVRTFPTPGQAGNYVVTFGACQSDNELDTIYVTIATHNPDLFFHMGDWYYPNNDSITRTTTNVYARQWGQVTAAYRNKYDDQYMRPFLANHATGYVYDDCDYVEGNSSSLTASYIRASGTDVDFAEPAFDSTSRRNAIRGYYELYPHYPLVDTAEGIYHSFRLGNIEVFMLDLRSRRSPNLEIFRKTSNFLAPWVYDPPAGHTIMGDIQKQWLKDALLNSTATWKILVCSVPFNKAYNQLMTLALQAQRVTIPGQDNGGFLAGKLADGWSGFQADQAELYDFCVQNDIRNIVVTSGDSHMSAIDDGANAGFPEIMAANLARENGAFFSQLEFLFPSRNLWNRGGQGIGNDDLEYAFGKIETFGNDSLRMSIVDKNNKTIASYTMVEGRPLGTDPLQKLNGAIVSLAPNPVTSQLTVTLDVQAMPKGPATLAIHALDGRRIAELPVDPTDPQQRINTQAYAPGVYFVRLQVGGSFVTKPFLKQ